MAKSTHQILVSDGFKRLVKDRWAAAFILTAVEFLLYYGFVLTIAMNPGLHATKIGQAATLGIPFAVLVIVFSWVLTFIYVTWANNSYDPEVAAMSASMKGKGKKKKPAKKKKKGGKRK